MPFPLFRRKKKDKKLKNMPAAEPWEPPLLHTAEASIPEVSEVFNANGKDLQFPYISLCEACRTIFSVREPSEAWYRTWHPYPVPASVLYEGGNPDCAFCATINEHLLENEKTTGRLESLKFKVLGIFFLVAGPNYNDGSLAPASDPELVLNLEMYAIYAQPPSGWGQDGVGTSLPFTAMIPSRPDSQETWDLCRSWLRRCQKTHTQCGSMQSDASYRPKRLVHVIEDAAGGLSARLVCYPKDETFTERIRYTTLSHCWGSIKFFTLTSANLDDLQKNIPLSVLSQVFKDALRTTVALGYNYIWIDSLCIIQDSKEDWFEQSSGMGQIYRNCVCNIAATGFENGSKGFLMERKPDLIQCRYVQTNWGKRKDMERDDDRDKEWVQPTLGKYHFAVTHIWKTKLGEAPLVRRGWVLQERILAPCVIHFCKGQIFWDCLQSCACESFPDKMPTWIRYGTQDYSQKSSQEHMPLPQLLPDPYRGRSNFNDVYGPRLHPRLGWAYCDWHNVVEVHSKNDLTVSEDKLVAISGLAKIMRDILEGDRYLAGIWRHTFLADLTWTTKFGSSSSSATPAEYRAPTWSWASLDLPINFPLPVIEWGRMFAEVLEIELKHATEDDTGLVRGGFARFRGVLMKPLKQRITGSSRHCDYKWTSDSKEEWSSPSAYFDLPHAQARTGRPIDADGHEIDMSSYMPGEQHYLMPIGLTKDNVYAKGLVLARSGRADGEYVRLGTFNDYDNEKHPERYALSKGKIEKGDYESVAEDGRYVFTII